MPEEVIVGHSIIIPSSISSATLPRTSILTADLNKLREEKFLFEIVHGIQPQAILTRKEIDQIIKNIPNEKCESLINYIRIKIVFGQFDQVDNWIKAGLESPNLPNKSEFYFVLAEVNYHQGYFQDSELYLNKSNNLSESHPLFLAHQSLRQDLTPANLILTVGNQISVRETMNELQFLECPPILPMLRVAIDSAYYNFRNEDYISSIQAVNIFDHYHQSLMFDMDQETKLLHSCMALMKVASKVQLFAQNNIVNYAEISLLLTELKSFHFGEELIKNLYPASDQIRNPILKIIKENAPKFVDCCNSMGVALFQLGQANGDTRFLLLARDVFQIQSQLTSLVFPNMEQSREAKIHVLTSLNSSDIALARDDFGSALQSLARVVKTINRSDEGFPVSLAAASSLRLGAMNHSIYVHLGDCLNYVEHSKSRRDNFPEYLHENHPHYLGIWKDRLDGVRPLTSDDVITLNLKACAYQGESAYSYRQFAGFGKEVKMAMLEQSNWSHQHFIDNVLALAEGRAPKYHSFLPLDVALAS